MLLCHFDKIKGPTVTHIVKVDKSSARFTLPPKVTEQIGKLIDTQTTENFFTYGFESYTAANLFFEIPSEWARAKRETLCMSLLIDSGKPEWFKDSMVKGAKLLKDIPDLYKAFYEEKKAVDVGVAQKQRVLASSITKIKQDVLLARRRGLYNERKRGEDRDSARDKARDRIRDEERDHVRDDARDQKRDEERDHARDDARDRKRDESPS